MNTTTPVAGWLRTSQIRRRYLDWGDPRAQKAEQRSGTAVLALHGLASSCHWYDLVIPYLADTYRCISLEQRGHGETDQPSTGYDWHTLARDVVESLDQLGLDRVAVLGHSWGGYVALSVAAYYPERASRLALIDGGFLDWTGWPGATWPWFKELLRPRDVSGSRQEFLNRLREQLADCWSDQLEGIVMTMVRVGTDGTVKDILEPTNHSQVLEAMWHEPPSTMYSRVRCPTLIVAAGPPPGGENSEFARMRREMAAAAQSAIEQCIVEWIPDTIHDIGYHKPAELARVLRGFLSGG